MRDSRRDGDEGFIGEVFRANDCSGNQAMIRWKRNNIRDRLKLNDGNEGCSGTVMTMPRSHFSFTT